MSVLRGPCPLHLVSALSFHSCWPLFSGTQTTVLSPLRRLGPQSYCTFPAKSQFVDRFLCSLIAVKLGVRF